MLIISRITETLSMLASVSWRSNISATRRESPQDSTLPLSMVMLQTTLTSLERMYHLALGGSEPIIQIRSRKEVRCHTYQRCFIFRVLMAIAKGLGRRAATEKVVAEVRGGLRSSKLFGLGWCLSLYCSFSYRWAYFASCPIHYSGLIFSLSEWFCY